MTNSTVPEPTPEQPSEDDEARRLQDLMDGAVPTPTVVAPTTAIKETPAPLSPDATFAEAIKLKDDTVELPFPASRRKVKLHPLVQQWSFKPKDAEHIYAHENISMPTVAASRMDEIAADVRNFEPADRAKLAEWIESYKTAGYLYPRMQRWSASVNREDGDWRQSIPSASGELEIRSPKLLSDADDTKMYGQKAVQYVRSKLGMGTLKAIPLWHSGFWVTMKMPATTDLLELYRRMSEAKVELGRNTFGMVYSNTRAYITALVAEFAIDHIFDSTINEKDVDYGALIASPDIQLLVAGIAALIYNKGFHYTTQCMVNPEECTETVSEKADVTKMVWTDKSKLSEAQIIHMSRFRGKTMSVQSVKDYQAQFASTAKRRVQIDEDTYLFLKLPSINEYKMIGAEWVSSITAMVDAALGLEVSEGERNKYINKQGKATLLRQYQHYVSHIESGPATIDTQEGIASLLTDLSGQPDKCTTFFDAVGDYIDDNTISLVATTDFVCPCCGKQQNDHSKPFTSLVRNVEIIPIFAEMVFFTMLAQIDQLVLRR